MKFSESLLCIYGGNVYSMKENDIFLFEISNYNHLERENFVSYQRKMSHF